LRPAHFLPARIVYSLLRLSLTFQGFRALAEQQIPHRRSDEMHQAGFGMTPISRRLKGAPSRALTQRAVSGDDAEAFRGTLPAGG